MSGDPSGRPGYARALRLRHLRPGGILCFLFFEGAAVLGALLALAELASWWSVAILPATVAAMVKINDVIAGAVRQPAGPDRAPVPGAAADTAPRTMVPRPAAPAALRPAVARASVPGINYIRPPAQRGGRPSTAPAGPAE